jgi:NitT/TauT family transport system substrate-binding protein
MKAPTRTLLAAALCTSLAALTPAGAAHAEKITIMVGGINKLIYLPPKLTENLGFFKEEGLDVELQSQNAGVDAENELVAGAVQAVVGFYDHTIDLQSKGKSIEAIVLFGLNPGAEEMVRADEAGTIKSMGDLKGKTVGITGLGSSSGFITQYLALQGGLKSSDYTLLPVGAGNTLIAAFKQKRIDVAWVTEPTTSQLKKTGDAKTLVNMTTEEGTKAALGGLYPASSLYVSSAWAAKHKDECAKLARAYVKTLQWIHSHTPEEIADKMPRDYYGGDKDLYVAAMKASIPMYSKDGKMPEGAPETALKVLSAFNPNIKGKHIDLSKTYTNEFVDLVK